MQHTRRRSGDITRSSILADRRQGSPSDAAAGTSSRFPPWVQLWLARPSRTADDRGVATPLRCLAVAGRRAGPAPGGGVRGRGRARRGDRAHHDRRRRRGGGRHPGRADVDPGHRQPRRRRADDEQLPTAPWSTDTVQCLRGTSLAVDLDAGNDRFRAPGGGRADQRRGRRGRRRARDRRRATTCSRAARATTRLDGHGGRRRVLRRDRRRRDRGARRARPSGSRAAPARTRRDNDFIDIIAECERGHRRRPRRLQHRRGLRRRRRRPSSPAPPRCSTTASTRTATAATTRTSTSTATASRARSTATTATPRSGRPRSRSAATGVDENCDRRAEPFADLGAVVANQWVFGPAFARLSKLVVHNAPRGARVVLRCSGRSCPSRRPLRRTVRSVLSRVVLHRGLRKARLRPGTRLVVTITAAETIGRTYTYVVKRGGPPESTIVCRAPGEREGAAMLRAAVLAAVAAACCSRLPPPRPARSRSRARRSSTTARTASTRSRGSTPATSIRFTRFGGVALGGGAGLRHRADGGQSVGLPEGRASAPCCSTSAAATTSPP